MKLRLIFVLICLLLLVNQVSAENRVTNGDFETGDLSGWSVGWGGDGDHTITVGTDYAYNGSYGCKLFARLGNDDTYAWIEQDVDLTGVDKLVFKYKVDTTLYAGFDVYIDSDRVFTDSGSGEWSQATINVGNYSGIHTIKFLVRTMQNIEGYAVAQVYLDDIVAEATAAANVTFYFYDVVNQQYLNNVTLDYSIDGTNYTAVFSTFDVLTLPIGSNLTIYNAHKYGFQSEYEAGQEPETWTITNDTDIMITFAPVQLDYVNIVVYFKDSSTGGLLKNVFVRYEKEYFGDTWSGEGYYDYYTSFTVPKNGVLKIYVAHKDGYESDIDRTGTLVIQADTSKEVDIIFYSVGVGNAVTFMFYDADAAFLLSDISFTLTGDDFSDSGVYDYYVTYTTDQLTYNNLYTYTAERTGYKPVSGSFTFTGGQVIKLYFVPDFQTEHVSDPVNNTALTFTVINSETKEPVEGAYITVNGKTKITNSQGFTWFEVPKNQAYSYTVGANGYFTVSGSVEVGGDQTDVTVELIPIEAIPTTTSSGGTGGDSGSSTGSGRLDEGIRSLYNAAPSLINLAILVAMMSMFGMLMRAVRRR